MIVGFAALLAGCNDPQTTDLRTRRQESLAWTFGSFRKIESQRPDSLGWALDTLRQQHEWDLADAAKNPARIGTLIQNDFDRWKANQPAYHDAVQRELEGHPNKVGQTAPKLVW
jgi:hypothetical protein